MIILIRYLCLVAMVLFFLACGSADEASSTDGPLVGFGVGAQQDGAGSDLDASDILVPDGTASSQDMGAGGETPDTTVPPVGTDIENGWVEDQWSSPNPEDTDGTLYDAAVTTGDAWSFPYDDGSYPYDEGSYPYDEWSYPYDDGSYPYDEWSYPYDDGGYPYDEWSYPYDDGGYPYDEWSYPYDEWSYSDGDPLYDAGGSYWDDIYSGPADIWDSDADASPYPYELEFPDVGWDAAGEECSNCQYACSSATWECNDACATSCTDHCKDNSLDCLSQCSGVPPCEYNCSDIEQDCLMGCDAGGAPCNEECDLYGEKCAGDCPCN